MSVEHNIEIDQGATWTKEISWQDSNHQPYNLTTWTARFTLSKDIADAKGVPVLVLTTPALNGITLGSTNPNIIIKLTSLQTSNIPHGRYVYDLELIAVAGDVTRLLRGTAFVIAEAGK